MKLFGNICAGLVVAGLLAACAANAPDPNTMQAMQTAVTAANVGETLYVASSHTSPANATKAAAAISTLDAAWTAYQTAVAAGQPGDMASLSAALAAAMEAETAQG